jgi:hypothetical protein
MHKFLYFCDCNEQEGGLNKFRSINGMCLCRLTFKASRSEDGSIETLRIDRRFFLACLIFIISAGMSEMVVAEGFDFNSVLPICSMFSEVIE